MKFFGKNKNEPYLGVELEIGYPQEFNLQAFNACTDSELARVKKLIPFDNSILLDIFHDGGGYEYAFCPIQLSWLQKEKNLKNFKTFFDYIQKEKFIPNNNIAGMHVHIDKEAYNGQQLKILLEFIAFNNQEIFKISRRTSKHSYKRQGTIKISKTKINTDLILNLIDYEVGSDEFTGTSKVFMYDSPQRFENVLKQNVEHGFEVPNGFLTIGRKGYPTIEFRMFNSTNNLTVFLGNIEFIHSLWSYTKKLIQAKNPKTFYKFSSYLSFVKKSKIYPNLIQDLLMLKLLKQNKKYKFRVN